MKSRKIVYATPALRLFKESRKAKKKIKVLKEIVIRWLIRLLRD